MSTIEQFIKSHCFDYQQRFQGVSLLDDVNRLPRDKCGLNRGTLDFASIAAHQKAVRENNAASRNDKAKKQVPPLLPISDLQIVQDLQTRKTKRLFITGEGGIGKTEYTRYLAYELSRLEQGAHLQVLPLLFELKHWRNQGDLFAQVVAHNSAEFSQLAAQGLVAFIFDGLDELQHDARQFEGDFGNLITRFPQCAFVVAGRQMPHLTFGQYGFTESARHILQPLNDADIHRYIFGYFDSGIRANELARELYRSSSAMRSLIRSPFMLAVTCLAVDNDSPDFVLPENPADLLEEGVRKLFVARKYQPNQKLGGPLILDDHTCLESLGALFASSTTTGYQTTIGNAVSALKSHLQLSEAEAATRLDQLAPASGLLRRAIDYGYASTNRVIAEFLAARWIALHGVPAQSNNEVDFDTAVLLFYSSNVWSEDHRGLLRWLLHALSGSHPHLLIAIADWLLKHIPPNPLPTANARSLAPRKRSLGVKTSDLNYPFDDHRRTLLHRYFDVLSAVRPSTSCAAHFQKADYLFPLQGLISHASIEFGFPFTDVESIAGISMNLRSGPLQGVIHSLQHHDATVDSLTSIVALHPDKRDEVGAILRSMLAQDDLSWDDAHKIAKLMIARYLDNPETMPALDARLKMFPDPELATLLLQALPEYRDVFPRTAMQLLNARACDFQLAEIAALLARRYPAYKGSLKPLLRRWVEEVTDNVTLWSVGEILSSTWGGDEELAETLLARFRNAPNSHVAARIGWVLILGWPNQRMEIIPTLVRLLERERDPDICTVVASVLPLGGDEYRNRAAKLLLEKIQNPPSFYAAICLMSCMAANWPSIRPLIQKALLQMLRSDEPELIVRASGALCDEWPGDEIIGKAIVEKFKTENRAAVFKVLAHRLAAAWVGDRDAERAIVTKIEERTEKWRLGVSTVAGMSVSASFLGKEADDEEEKKETLEDLTRSLALVAPGNVFAAARLYGHGDNLWLLRQESWKDWLVIHGPHNELEKYESAQGYGWAVGKDGFALMKEVVKEGFKPRPNGPWAVLVAPRNRVRQGLDRRLCPISLDNARPTPKLELLVNEVTERLFQRRLYELSRRKRRTVVSIVDGVRHSLINTGNPIDTVTADMLAKALQRDSDSHEKAREMFFFKPDERLNCEQAIDEMKIPPDEEGKLSAARRSLREYLEIPKPPPDKWTTIMYISRGAFNEYLDERKEGRW